MPVYLQAGPWGLLAGGTLVVGAAIAWFFRVPRLVVAGVMAFGAGVLFSALAFDLVDEAERYGGLPATVLGLVGCLTLGDAEPATISLVTAIAAGAILTMVADTMIPEAFADTRIWTGVIMTLGFITAFTLSRATA